MSHHIYSVWVIIFHQLTNLILPLNTIINLYDPDNRKVSI